MHRTAAPTLVVDNSFTLKTADPQRAFDPTGSIINRAIYDTLFTYKGSDLSNPIPLLVSSWKANKTARTIHLPAEEERPLRERQSADCGGRRLLAQPADQHQGQPVVPARRGLRQCERQVHRRHEGDGAVGAVAGDSRESEHGHRQREAREGARWNERRQRVDGRQGGAVAQLAELGRSGQRAVRAEVVQHHLAGDAFAEYALLGREEAEVRHRRRPEHGCDDAADQHPARLARSRHRPLLRSGAEPEEQQEAERVAAAVDMGLLALREQQQPAVECDLEQEMAGGRSLRAQLQLDRLRGRPGCDPDAGNHPVDVPRRLAEGGCDQAEPDAGEGGARGVRCGRPAGVARIPERPDDQRRAVHDPGADASRRTSRPPASRSSSRARRRPPG